MKSIWYLLGLNLVVGIILVLPSCTYNNEEEYTEDVTCDTIHVTFNDISYIFTGVCASCHYPNNPFVPGIVLNNYDNVKAAVRTNRVLGAIKHLDGYKPMPFDMPKRSDCEISKIQAWIDQGMPEN